MFEEIVLSIIGQDVKMKVYGGTLYGSIYTKLLWKFVEITLWYGCIFSEHLFLRKLLGGCFYIQAAPLLHIRRILAEFSYHENHSRGKRGSPVAELRMSLETFGCLGKF